MNLMRWLWRYLITHGRPCEEAHSLRWRVFYPEFNYSAEGNSPMSLTLTVTQQVELSVAPVDAYGNAAPVDGAPKWDVSDPSLLSCVPATDGMKALIWARGEAGHVQVTVTADARLGPDVHLIGGVLEIDILPNEAVALGISAGAPEEIPPLAAAPADPVSAPDPTPTTTAEPTPVDEAAATDQESAVSTPAEPTPGPTPVDEATATETPAIDPTEPSTTEPETPAAVEPAAEPTDESKPVDTAAM